MYIIFKLIALIIGMALNQTDSNQTTLQINELLKPWESISKPGIAVAVNKGDKTVYQKYHGVSNLENLTPITPETKFLIASVSKQFTAFAITLLADEKKLSLEDDVRNYIPQLPEYNHKITIMNLLNHTSGLRDSDDLNSLIGAGLSDYVSFNDVYQLILQQQKLNFIPGSKYDYSNSGYILLAKIVENTSGKSFREYMDEKVFKPLGMTNTLVFDNPFEIIGQKAIAYFSHDGINHSTNNLFSAVYGSTGIYTTLADLNKWAINFSNPKIGNKAIFKLMQTKGILSDGSVINYGLGQEMKSHKGHEVVFHGGGQGAYRAYLLRFPNSDLSVTLLSNSSYSTSFIIDYAFKIAELFLDEPQDQSSKEEKDNSIKQTNGSTDFQPVTVNKSTLSHYVGDYQIQPGLIFTINQKEGGLELTITGNENAIKLKAKTTNEFVLMDSNNGYRIVFPKDTTQQVDLISYYQHDFEYIGQRVYLVKFDKDSIQWGELEGLFYSKELNTVYSLKYDGKELLAHHARNLPIKITPHQPDIYYGDASFFQEIKFERNNSGEVVGMLVSGSRSKDINFVKLPILVN